ncbi:hypothetical protein FAF17_10030, partial [Staphylococcus aureus]
LKYLGSRCFKYSRNRTLSTERLFFYPILKGSELMKIKNQESKGRSPPFKTITQIRFIQT